MDDNFLKLENQLCFPLYVVSKEIVRKYKPFLDKLNLTYTQYIVMLTLWEYGKTNVKDLGDKLFLDSGTLTPLLKKLEVKKYIVRNISSVDERNLVIELTNKGLELKNEALSVPINMKKCINLTSEEGIILYKLLYKVLDELKEEEI